MLATINFLVHENYYMLESFQCGTNRSKLEYHRRGLTFGFSSHAQPV